MTARRRAGEGGISSYDTSRGKRWSVVYRAYDPQMGKVRQFRLGGFTRERDAQKALRDRLTAVDQQTHVAPSALTLKVFVETRWLPALRSQVRQSTYDSYERNLRLHVQPRLGDTKLTQLDAGALTALYQQLLEGGRQDHKTGQGLSARSVAYVHTILKACLSAAVEWDLLTRNPAERARAPKAKAAGQSHEKIATWTRDQASAFLTASEAAEERLHPLWLLLLTTGLRRGEAIGLRWEVVDLDTGRISIRRSLVDVTPDYAGSAPVWSDPKTSAGRRVVQLDPGTVSVLKAVRKRTAAEKLLFGEGYRDHDLVFAHPDGRPLHPERLSRSFGEALRRHAAPKIRLHDMRHTWATLALEAGVHPRVVQERLGHSNVTITLQTYSHVSPAMQTDAADRVAALILGGSSL